MKKFKICKFLIIIFLTSIRIIFAQEIWDYPIKPGSIEWKNFKTTKEMITACQLPEDVLKNIATKELFQLWMKYPLRQSMLLHNTLQDGFQYQTDSFNGLNELINRNNSGMVILNEYKVLSSVNIDSLPNPKLKIRYDIDIALVELLLSQSPILNKLNNDENKECLIIAIENTQKRKLYEIDFVFWSQQTAILLIGRSLNHDKVEKFISLYTNDYSVRKAMETGLVHRISKTSADEIISIANEYLNQ